MAGLAARTDDVERQLLAQTAETEALSSRIHELEGRLADQSRALAEREAEAARAHGELEAARKLESDLREQLSNASARSSGAIERMRSEIGQLEAQLAAANQDRSTLQGEIVTMRREAESSWAAERVENALLRERINDVAAEVARLTAALEGRVRRSSPCSQRLYRMLASGEARMPGLLAARARRAAAPIRSRAKGHSPSASAHCNRALRAPRRTKAFRIFANCFLRSRLPRTTHSGGRCRDRTYASSPAKGTLSR